MRESCDEVLAVLGLENDPLFRLAKKLENIALEDEYFVSKKLYPNVDFYSGIILKALGIPVEMFTVIFATGRTVGWISHWNEMITHPYRIGRPRQLYTGADVRDYPAVEIVKPIQWRFQALKKAAQAAFFNVYQMCSADL